MPIYYKKGDAIKGEMILFDCRKFTFTKLINRTSTHKAQAGKLENAYCVINRQFRLIPDNENEKKEK
ncbi:TPA: hypothetical protein ENS27_16235 [bacterium]|jgi:hypothetical protein|nr:hypothetical protein [bacterium]